MWEEKGRGIYTAAQDGLSGLVSPVLDYSLGVCLLLLPSAPGAKEEFLSPLIILSIRESKTPDHCSDGVTPT